VEKEKCTSSGKADVHRVTSSTKLQIMGDALDQVECRPGAADDGIIYCVSFHHIRAGLCGQAVIPNGRDGWMSVLQMHS